MEPTNHHEEDQSQPGKTSNNPVLSMKGRKGGSGERRKRKRGAPEADNTHASMTSVTRILTGKGPTRRQASTPKPGTLTASPGGTSLCSSKARKLASESKAQPHGSITHQQETPQHQDCSGSAQDAKPAKLNYALNSGVGQNTFLRLQAVWFLLASSECCNFLSFLESHVHASGSSGQMFNIVHSSQSS